MGEDVDFVHGAGVLCGAVCGSQGDQAQADAHCGMRGLIGLVSALMIVGLWE